MVMFSPRIIIQLVLAVQGVCFAAIRHQKSAKNFGLLSPEPKIFDKQFINFLEYSDRPSVRFEFRRLVLNKLLTDYRSTEKTSYLFRKNVLQRDKRYTSQTLQLRLLGKRLHTKEEEAEGLTMCHFKICPMGRKRTARHFHYTDYT